MKNDMLRRSNVLNDDFDYALVINSAAHARWRGLSAAASALASAASAAAQRKAKAKSKQRAQPPNQLSPRQIELNTYVCRMQCAAPYFS